MSLRGWAGAVAAALLAHGVPAHAQQELELPEVVVTAPSPAARPKAKARPAKRRPAPAPVAAPAPPPEPAIPPPGWLRIVTNQFATTTVVTSEELRRSPGGTLGDVLFAKPGITGSRFAAGAPSPPLLRGLGEYR